MAIIVLMGLLILIQSTNMSMMTTAQSDIAADLDAFAEATWFTAAFMIAMSSITPLAGRLSQIFTPRLYVIFSSALLAIGLFITAAAPSLAVFLLGRVVAGSGSGGLMSTSIILALTLASQKRRGLCLGLISLGYTTGLASGAVLAGLLTPILGWRFIFWIQAPLSLLLGPLLFLAIPSLPKSNIDIDHRETLYGSLSRSLARVDYAGAAALTISVVLLLFSLASPTVTAGPIVLSLLCFAGFLVIESRWTAEPVIPVGLLRTRSVLLTCLAGLGLMMARWAVLFYSPVYAMAVRGWSPASAGLILVPTNAGFGLGGVLVGWLHIRKARSYYGFCLLFFLLFVLAVLTLSLLSTPQSPTAAYLLALFLNGLFAGAVINYTLSHLLYLTSPSMQYIVSALVAMSRGFAASFGSAVGGGLFTRILKASLETGFATHGVPSPELVRQLLGSPAMVRGLPEPERLIAMQSYERAIRILFLAGSVLALVAAVVQAGTGWTPVENPGNEGEDSGQVT
ncbi:hypothetical protein NUU61_003423 [Penicillium alfredii]|uniref:Major facilitator superfamily (MFS) profile domain-containing protein n=1 Tax=Penicillium alfredii TaxID=1506179 RepID=A0A9W9FTB4_9EURO|nr:uncharacterized protein NUU61_003423 [Penicillium alfredii]KAJ5106076.1 hypothetical protein NUU61_003423 [Penicillium alfredii]